MDQHVNILCINKCIPRLTRASSKHTSTKADGSSHPNSSIQEMSCATASLLSGFIRSSHNVDPRVVVVTSVVVVEVVDVDVVVVDVVEIVEVLTVLVEVVVVGAIQGSRSVVVVIVEKIDVEVEIVEVVEVVVVLVVSGARVVDVVVVIVVVSVIFGINNRWVMS